MLKMYFDRYHIHVWVVSLRSTTRECQKLALARFQWHSQFFIKQDIISVKMPKGWALWQTGVTRL